jgi:predicted enzyme related to lactoylglutathione lyase
MASVSTHRVVHLELHTGNLPRACGFYTGLFSWRLEQIRMGSGSYLTLDWGSGIEGAAGGAGRLAQRRVRARRGGVGPVAAEGLSR